MTDAKIYLAVDLGAESGRVIAGIHNQDQLKLEVIHSFPNGGARAADGHLHWRVDELFAQIVEGLTQAHQQFGKQIVCLGVDTWGVDYGLFDAEDRLIAPPYCYRDERHKGRMEEAFDIIGRHAMYQRAGLQFMPFNTIFQLMAEDEQRLDDADSLLFMPDLFTFWLSGKKINEMTIASTSQLLLARELKWDTELMDQLGIPPELFREPTAPGTVVGPLIARIAEQTGCENVNVIAVGGHDTASAIAAVPFRDPQRAAYLSSGTWSLLGIESPEPIINDTSEQMNITNERGLEHTFRVLKNISGLWIIQECRRAWAEAGEEYDYAELVELARQAEPFKAVIDVNDPPFIEVGNMPAKIQSYCERTSQPVPQDKGQMIRIATEGLALKYAHVLDDLQTLKGSPIETLHIVGGGSQNELLNQMTANAIGRQVITGPIEGTAAGNVLAQMLADGQIASIQDGRDLISRSFDVKTYEPQDADAWQTARQTYQSLVDESQA